MGKKGERLGQESYRGSGRRGAKPGATQGRDGRPKGGIKENQEMRCKHLVGNFIFSTSHTSGIKRRQRFVIRQTGGKSQLSLYTCDLVTCLFLPQFPQM